MEVKKITKILDFISFFLSIKYGILNSSKETLIKFSYESISLHKTPISLYLYPLCLTTLLIFLQSSSTS